MVSGLLCAVDARWVLKSPADWQGLMFGDERATVISNNKSGQKYLFPLMPPIQGGFFIVQGTMPAPLPCA